MDIYEISLGHWRPLGAPLKNYFSLIWTERYSTPSDFELKTYDVKGYREALPIGRALSIRGSDEVMLIEEQFIETDENGLETMTLRGKSLTSYLEHRVVGEIRSVKYVTAQNYTKLDAALLLMYNSFVNDQPYDYTKAQAAAYKNPNDAFVSAVISDGTSSLNAGESRPRFIEPGPIKPLVENWLKEYPAGLRIRRPISNFLNVVTVDQSGVITKTPTYDLNNKFAFEVYNGVDRSIDQATIKPLILDVEHDDLILPNYLYSQLGYKTEAHIMTDKGSLFAYSGQEPGLEENQGVYRRVRYIDAGQPEEGITQADFERDSIESAQNALKDNYKKYLVDGSVSTQAEEKYGVDYFLGDILTVRGRYGISANARVTEYIRSETESGESGYPTLEYVS